MTAEPSWVAIAAIPAARFWARWLELESQAIRDEQLRERFRGNVGDFLRYCFPVLYSRPWNKFHLELLNRDKSPPSERRENSYRVDAAPRGIAKTTLLKGEIVHDIVYGLEDFIVVVSAETRLARSITKHLRRIFMAPGGDLARLYGPFVVEGGVDEFSVVMPNGRRVGVLARSFGTQIRGANEDAVRPTKIAVDDGERSDRVRNPKLRRDDWEFLQDDILTSGPITGGLNVDWRGTVLNVDAILPNLLSSDGWDGALWKSCESWPDRIDLWHECGRIFADLTRGKVKVRRRAAWEFYQAHKADMDHGAVMLDEAAMTLFEFWIEIWTKGMRSVLRERQNEATAPGTKFFRVYETTPGAGDGFALCDVVGTKATGGHLITADGRKVKLADIRFYARLDPIPGDDLDALGEETGAGQGDDACIAILGRDSYGYGYVVACWFRRCRDSEQIKMLWTLCEDWQCEKVTVESNGFQRLLGREFKRQQAERREAGKFWQVRVDEDTAASHDNKNERIATLEPPITNRQLQFARTLPPKLFREFDGVPTGDHDDGPDAVEGAWRLSNTVRPGMVAATFAR